MYNVDDISTDDRLQNRRLGYCEGGVMARILVVDDEEPIAKLLRNILESLGHKVDIATNAREFMKAIQGTPYELLVTDLMMPEMDGFMCIQKAKEIYPNIGIVIITGSAPIESDKYKKAKSLAHRIIAKPFNPMDIQAAVATYFESKRNL